MNVVQQGDEADTRFERDRPDEMAGSEIQRLHQVSDWAVIGASVTGIPWPMSGPTGHLVTWSRGARRRSQALKKGRSWTNMRKLRSSKSPLFHGKVVKG